MNPKDSGFYEFNTVIVKQLGSHTVKIVEMPVCRISGMESGPVFDSLGNMVEPQRKESKAVSSGKLDNNISRTRTRVKELAQCNSWDYWCTFTLDESKKDRYDLQSFTKGFHDLVRNYNRRCEESFKVKYLVIPERHKDGAWHMHGFIKGIRPADLVENKHGYLEWRQYVEKFGYISMEPLRDPDKASSYMMKYITKDLQNTVTARGARAFYSSHGLNQPEVIYRGHAYLHGSWDYEHPDGYCRIKTIDTREIDLSEILEVLP